MMIGSLESLPPEILIQIFSHNSPIDQANTSRVCKKFYHILHDPSLWRGRFHDYWPLTKQFDCSFKENGWKDRFIQLYQLEHNPLVKPLRKEEQECVTYFYKDAEVTVEQILHSTYEYYQTTIHTSLGYSYVIEYPEKANFIKVNKDQIICIYDNGLIGFYNLYKNKINLSASPPSIDIGTDYHYFDSLDLIVICGDASAGAIKAYDRVSGCLIHELKDQCFSFLSLKSISSSVLIACKNGQLVKWDLNNNRVSQLYQHTDQLLTTTSNEDYFASADASGIICLYHIKTQQITTFATSHKFPIIQLLIEKNALISADDQGYIEVWYTKTKTYFYTLAAHEQSISAIASFQSFMLATGTKTGEIKIWNLLSGKCLATFNQEKSGIDSLYLDDQKLISYHRNKALKTLTVFKSPFKSEKRSWPNWVSYLIDHLNFKIRK